MTAVSTCPPRVEAVRRRAGGIAKAAIGLAILIALVAEVGAEPFVRGLTALSPLTILLALALTAVATTAASWRWCLIARRLDLSLGWSDAFAAYYRSQFLNSVLPGGILGDVHRAVAHGRSVARVGQASRAVAAERGAGQVVQIALAVVLLAALGVWAYAPVVGVMLLAVVVACAGVFVAGRVSVRARAALAREGLILRIAFGDLRTLLGVAAMSLVVIVAHVTTFFVASLAVGIDAPPAQIAAAAVVAVVAGSIPVNIAGWGPREAVAVWAFAALGLGAAAGLAASTAYGVLALVSVLPGALVIAASALSARSRPVSPVISADMEDRA